MKPEITTSFTLRGRKFTASSIGVVKSCVKKYYKFGRTRISKEVCKRLDWKQPNGWLKDRACRDALVQLEKMGVIKLPEPKVKRKTKKENNAQEPKLGKYIIPSEVTEIPVSIDFVLAKGNKEEQIWNYLVEQYHYLGHKVIVGRTLKYLIVSENVILGAIAYSSPAWNLSPRNQILQKLGFTREDILNKVINNSRFLILPTVKVKNLASKILSLSTVKVVSDWAWYYSITPLVAETFVQPSRYLGTSYKAANWQEIGITKGYAKSGMSYRNSQEPKKIYLYGLSNEVRSMLMKVLSSRSEMEQQ
ncbi:MAG: Druantia anti-phage system protein DruA [Chloroflexota bacterium]